MSRNVVGALVVASVLAGGFVFRQVASGEPASVNVIDVPISRVVPTEYAAPLAPFSVRFAEEAVPPDTSPTLPTGVPGVSDRDALSAAAATLWGGSQLPLNTLVAARYGLYSNDVMAEGGPGVPMHLLYQNVPAWIVTFYGPDLTFHPRGPAPGVKHAMNYVVDAATGKVLVAFG